MKRNRPSSAGVCHKCRKHVKKRYGGEGRYFAYCINCWITLEHEDDAAESKLEPQA